MPASLTEERVRTGLERLYLRQMATEVDRLCAEASQQELSYLEFLDRLLEAELNARWERNITLKKRWAHLPYHKTMADFDYGFQPALDKKQVNELFTLRFIAQAENVLLLGPPGVGKTHIAAALALEAISQGHTAYFITMQHLIDHLGEGPEPPEVKMRVLLRPKVLVIDEVGYLPLGREAANWFFELVSRRYEKGAIILTSNKSYGDWGSLFPDVALAAAILDRLLHHSTTLNIRGESYRLKERRKAGLFQHLEPPPAD
jgi:DNA replication protein DnaC